MKHLHSCYTCGQAMQLDENEVSNHLTEERTIDYDADANHVAFPDIGNDETHIKYCGGTTYKNQDGYCTHPTCLGDLSNECGEIVEQIGEFENCTLMNQPAHTRPVR